MSLEAHGRRVNISEDLEPEKKTVKLKSQMLARISELERITEASDSDKWELATLKLKMEILTNLERSQGKDGVVKVLRDELQKKEEKGMAPSRLLLYQSGSFPVSDVLAAYNYLIQELQ